MITNRGIEETVGVHWRAIAPDLLYVDLWGKTRVRSKRCTRCKKMKYITEFYLCAGSKHKTRSWCVKCYNKDTSERATEKGYGTLHYFNTVIAPRLEQENNTIDLEKLIEILEIIENGDLELIERLLCTP